jgi:hypothetical protein
MIAADWVSHWLERSLTKSRRDTARHAGTIGPVVFYVIAYAGLYCAYLLLDLHGPASLLPRAWRYARTRPTSPDHHRGSSKPRLGFANR